MEFLTIQQFRNCDPMNKLYRNVTLFDNTVLDVIDQIHSNYSCERNMSTIDDDVRPRKLRYNINKRKWSLLT